MAGNGNAYLKSNCKLQIPITLALRSLVHQYLNHDGKTVFLLFTNNPPQARSPSVVGAPAISLALRYISL
jgi:hypothetical protein